MQSARVLGFVGLALCATAQAGPTALTVKDAAAGQGNFPFTALTFTVERTGDLSYPVTIEFVSEPDPEAATPAVPEVDFLARYITSYELPAGEPAPTIPVSLPRAGPAQPDRGLVVRIESVGVPEFERRRDVCVDAGADALATADFNGDGLADLAVGMDGGRFSICMNRSANDNIAFSEPTAFAVHTPGEWPYEDVTGVAAGDLDGDGRIDLVVSNGSNNTVYVLANRTPDLAQAPDFEIVQAFPVTNGVGAVTLADFDGDGRLDLVAGGRVGSCPQGSYEGCTSDIYPFVNVTGPGAAAPRFEALERILARMFVYRMLAEDFTGDGRRDLVAVTSAGVDLFPNATTGATPAFGARRSLMDTAVGTAAADVEAADLDGDGLLDLAVVHEYGSVSVLTALGGGAFSAPELVYVEPLRDSGHQEGPVTVRAIDFNNDRKPDLAVGNWLAHDSIDDGLNGGHSTVTLLANRSAPGIGYRFPVDSEHEVAGGFLEFTTADIDGDGRIDIVTPAMYERRVSILRRADRAVDLVRGAARGTALATLPALQFAPVTGAPASATVASEEVVISGITYEAPVTLSAGTYTVNGTPRTGASLVRAGDVIRLEVQSASTGSAESKASLMVGGIGGDFTVTTAPALESASASSSGGGPLAPASIGALLLAVLLRRRHRDDRRGAFQ